MAVILIAVADTIPWQTVGRLRTTVNAPDARGLHTAVWTGTEMIIWGGRGASKISTPVADTTQTRIAGRQLARLTRLNPEILIRWSGSTTK